MWTAETYERHRELRDSPTCYGYGIDSIWAYYIRGLPAQDTGSRLDSGIDSYSVLFLCKGSGEELVRVMTAEQVQEMVQCNGRIGKFAMALPQCQAGHTSDVDRSTSLERDNK